ncbi:MAG: alanine racemase, partial [Cetobacterium sp.]
MRTWAEIDLDNLEYNIKKIKELSHDKDIMAIIKADAYGMGAVTIA